MHCSNASILFTLDKIDILCLVFQNFCASKIIVAREVIDRLQTLNFILFV